MCKCTNFFPFANHYHAYLSRTATTSHPFCNLHPNISDLYGKKAHKKRFTNKFADAKLTLWKYQSALYIFNEFSHNSLKFKKNNIFLFSLYTRNTLWFTNFTRVKVCMFSGGTVCMTLLSTSKSSSRLEPLPGQGTKTPRRNNPKGKT